MYGCMYVWMDGCMRVCVCVCSYNVFVSNKYNVCVAS